jgi:hypothetical protein
MAQKATELWHDYGLFVPCFGADRTHSTPAVALDMTPDSIASWTLQGSAITFAAEP